MTIGTNIALYRKRRGMTQKEFGVRISQELGREVWSGSTVSQAETGKRAFGAAEVVAICNVLNASVEDLFHGAPLPESPKQERHVMIPAVRDAIRSIRTQLEELERNAD